MRHIDSESSYPALGVDVDTVFEAGLLGWKIHLAKSIGLGKDRAPFVNSAGSLCLASISENFGRSKDYRCAPSPIQIAELDEPAVIQELPTLPITYEIDDEVYRV
jgi:hypothetical protein